MRHHLPSPKNTIFKRGVLVACAMAALIIITATACSFEIVAHNASEESSLPAPSPIDPMPSATTQDTLGIDFDAYKTALNAEDYASLSRFFPVLLEYASFSVGYAPSADEGWVAQETTLDRFRKETDSMAMYAESPKISSFALCDMDQDGEQELILAFDNIAGTFLVLHQNEDKFQGVIEYTRGFQMLQTNGVYNATGGAATNVRQRMTFEDGSVQIADLAREDGTSGQAKYWIGEKEVTDQEYNNWIADHSPGEVIWCQ